VKDAGIFGLLENAKDLEYVLNVRARIGIRLENSKGLNIKGDAMSEVSDRRQCAECPETYELIPPGDSAYSIPKERKTTDDCITRFYECKNGHRNTIYWEKQPLYYGSTEYKTIGKQKQTPEELDDI